MKKNNIPIAFTFDDNYALPAAIAIKSLMESKKKDTQYEIFCLFSNLSDKNRNILDTIAPINRIDLQQDIFKDAPVTSEYPISVYYRLALHDILSQYDKILYSDVDVLFQKDLTTVYNTDMTNFYRAGVPLEKNKTPSLDTILRQVGHPNDPQFMSGHTKFPENLNKDIFASGFMVINAKKMRENRMTENFLETIKHFEWRLKMFDLDILNLTCQDNTIKALPFDYCVLEDIVMAKDYKNNNLYPFLSRVFSDKELKSAINNPAILHYTGSNSVRIWNREEKKQHIPYRSFFNIISALLI
jgi:lipopolysaccharide biosynthesis glycosyltransferase